MTTKTKSYTRIASVAMILLLLLCVLPMSTVAAASVPSVNTTFTFTETGVTADGAAEGYKIEGTALQINQPGVYAVTGTCSEGSVTVKKGITGVTLVLRDLTLASAQTAPLTCGKESEVTLLIVGTVTLTDREDLANEDTDDFEGAAIKVKSGASLMIDGTGVLDVNGACKNGIKGASLSTVTVAGGTVNVTAANHGIACDNEVILSGGTIHITAQNEGVKASPDEDDADSLGNVTVTGGVITIDAADDGIHADGDLTVSGGRLTISAGDDALKAEYALTVNDGEIIVTKCSEGFEGATVTLNGGSARITASDDGINAANGDLTGYAFSLTINGGNWYVDAGGDALDSNGKLTVTGDVTEVYGAANNGNAALDFDGGYTHTGGTLLAVGMSGMAQTPTSGAYVIFGSTGMGGMMQQPGQIGQMGGMMQQPGQMGQMGGTMRQPDQIGQMGGMMQSGAVAAGQTASGSVLSLAAGNTIEIKDSNDNVLYSATAVRNANSVVFVSDRLTTGQTYTLCVNGSAVATATVGAGSGMQDGMMPGNQLWQGQNSEGSSPQMPSQEQGMNINKPQMPSQEQGMNVNEPQMFDRGQHMMQQPGQMDQMGGAPLSGLASIGRFAGTPLLGLFNRR